VSTDARLFAEARRDLDAELDRVFRGVRRVAALMYPLDGNVGNHMMWVAMTDYFRERSIRVVYVAHARNLEVDELRRAVGPDPIVFSGGVTFSRLWPDHAAAKRQVAAAFPDNLLVSWPSTMLFIDDDDRREASQLFGDHERVVVFARDPQSAASARDALPFRVEVVTVPDSAFRLPRGTRRTEAAQPVLGLARDDHEGSGVTLPPDIERFDWTRDLSAVGRPGYVALRGAGALARVRSTSLGGPLHAAIDPAIAEGLRRFSNAAVALGHRELDRGAVLVTDRFHPHVLAALRGQPVVLLPDQYGKNRAVYDYLSHRLACVHWCDTPATALEVAEELARSPAG
jgi:pyruvyl transferase EpsO